MIKAEQSGPSHTMIKKTNSKDRLTQNPAITVCKQMFGFRHTYQELGYFIMTGEVNRLSNQNIKG